jgi:hypothetical protein
MFHVRQLKKLDELLETGELQGHKLTKHGAAPDLVKEKAHLITAFKTSIQIRFKDLYEDLKPTMIASLNNWPAEMTGLPD